MMEIFYVPGTRMWDRIFINAESIQMALVQRCLLYSEWIYHDSLGQCFSDRSKIKLKLPIKTPFAFNIKRNIKCYILKMNFIQYLNTCRLKNETRTKHLALILKLQFEIYKSSVVDNIPNGNCTTYHHNVKGCADLLLGIRRHIYRYFAVHLHSRSSEIDTYVTSNQNSIVFHV